MDAELILRLDKHTSPNSFAVVDNLVYTVFKYVECEPYINVYELSTKKQIFSAECRQIRGAYETHIYKNGDEVKLLCLQKVYSRTNFKYHTQMRRYLVAFDFAENTLKTELEEDVRMRGVYESFQWLPGNLISARSGDCHVSVFSPDNTELESYRCSRIYFASFRHNDHYVILDEKCESAVLKHIYNGGITTEKLHLQDGIQISESASRRAFVFDDAVFLVDMESESGKILLLIMSSLTLYDITDRVNQSAVSAGYQDKEAVYFCTQDYKMFKIQVKGRDFRFLAKDKHEQVSPPREPFDQSEDTSCPVCFESFTTPKMLIKCGHSICEACEVALTVDPGLSLDKTLTCPVCRVVTNLASDEVLPTNWSLKSLACKVGGVKISETLCHSCNSGLPGHRIFECSKCPSDLDVHQVLICGDCAVEKHSDHISDVKKATFLDAETVAKAVARVELPGVTFAKELANICNLSFHVSQKLLKYDERANRTIEKMKLCRTLTQNGFDKYMEELEVLSGNIKEGNSVFKQTLETMKKFLRK